MQKEAAANVKSLRTAFFIPLFAQFYEFAHSAHI